MTIGALILPEATRSLKAKPGLVPLAVAEPADPGRQPLEADLVASAPQPLLQPVIVAEEIHHRLVGDLDVARVTRQRHPAERALALTEQWPDVGRHEPGNSKARS